MSDGPINYTSQFAPVTPPTIAFAQGLGIADRANAQIQAQQAAEAQARAEAQRKQQVQALIAKINSPQGTAEDRLTLTTLVAPEQAKVMQSHMDTLDADKLNGSIKDSLGIFAALDQGAPDTAIDLMSQIRDARKSDGDMDGAKLMDTWIESAKINPNFAKDNIATLIVASKEGRDALDGYLKLHPAAEAPKLSTQGETTINKAVEDQSDLLSQAVQYGDIADAIDRAKPAGGWAGKTWEEVKKITGGQDIVTTLKQEWLRLKNPEVLKTLPPGAASDLDIKTAQAAFPDENANPAQIASFARGIAKLKGYQASVNGLKAGWVSANETLGTAKQDFSLTVPGQTDPVAIKKGDTFRTALDKLAVPKIASGQLAATNSAPKPVLNGLSVTDQDGLVHTFPDAAKAKKFYEMIQ